MNFVNNITTSAAKTAGGISNTIGNMWNKGKEAIGNIGNSVSSMFNADNSASQAAVENDREYASNEAEKNRDFEKEMSNTAYQRGIEDMQKAGLNPALMYQQGGASTPSGGYQLSSSSYQESRKNEQTNSRENLKIFSDFVQSMMKAFTSSASSAASMGAA